MNMDVGVSMFMGGESTPSRAVVQSAGHGYRLRASSMKEEFNRGWPALHLLLRYTQALITQMAQTAVCNRHHTLDQQLCRGQEGKRPVATRYACNIMGRIGSQKSNDSAAMVIFPYVRKRTDQAARRIDTCQVRYQKSDICGRPEDMARHELCRPPF